MSRKVIKDGPENIEDCIKMLFSLCISGLLKSKDINDIAIIIERMIKENNLSLNQRTGELWQQIQDYR